VATASAKRLRETATWAIKERESVITMPNKKEKPGGRQRMIRNVSGKVASSPRAPRMVSSSGACSIVEEEKSGARARRGEVDTRTRDSGGNRIDTQADQLIVPCMLRDNLLGNLLVIGKIANYSLHLLLV
jgi:hypothetical protein